MTDKGLRTTPPGSLCAARDLLDEAAPRPWYFDGWDVFTTGPTDDTGGHRLVFPLPHETFHPSQMVSKADAKLAVLAVNEYEELLTVEAQVRQALNAWREGIDHDADFLCLEKHLERLDALR